MLLSNPVYWVNKTKQFRECLCDIYLVEPFVESAYIITSAANSVGYVSEIHFQAENLKILL